MKPLVAAVKSLVDAFPHRNVTDDTIMRYVEDLEDLPEPLVCEAIKRLRRTSTFLPAIAEIRGLVIDAVVPTTNTGDAWKLVEKQILRYGYDRESEITFDDPAIMAAVKAVGWKRICLEDRSKADYVMRDFTAALEREQRSVRLAVQDGTAAIGGGNVTALDRRAS